jgi:hypothetical protein
MNQINSIPKATNREPVVLNVEEPGYIANVVIQEAVPGIVCKVLRRTPPETELANAVECSIVVTETARKT